MCCCLPKDASKDALFSSYKICSLLQLLLTTTASDNHQLAHRFNSKYSDSNTKIYDQKPKFCVPIKIKMCILSPLLSFSLI